LGDVHDVFALQFEMLAPQWPLEVNQKPTVAHVEDRAPVSQMPSNGQEHKRNGPDEVNKEEAIPLSRSALGPIPETGENEQRRNPGGNDANTHPAPVTGAPQTDRRYAQSNARGIFFANNVTRARLVPTHTRTFRAKPDIDAQNR